MMIIIIIILLLLLLLSVGLQALRFYDNFKYIMNTNNTNINFLFKTMYKKEEEGSSLSCWNLKGIYIYRYLYMI